MYLVINNLRPGYLSWFGLPPGSFKVALGADGAPFGKHNQGTAWLLSFLNVGDRVASCDDNHLICGANCSEEHPSMIAYGKQVRADIERIQEKSCLIDEVNVIFSFELIPAYLEDYIWKIKSTR